MLKFIRKKYAYKGTLVLLGEYFRIIKERKIFAIMFIVLFICFLLFFLYYFFDISIMDTCYADEAYDRFFGLNQEKELTEEEKDKIRAKKENLLFWFIASLFFCGWLWAIIFHVLEDSDGDDDSF